MNEVVNSKTGAVAGVAYQAPAKVSVNQGLSEAVSFQSGVYENGNYRKDQLERIVAADEETALKRYEERERRVNIEEKAKIKNILFILKPKNLFPLLGAVISAVFASAKEALKKIFKDIAGK